MGADFNKDAEARILIQGKRLKVLTPDQIRRIDALLAALGEGDELRLIVQNGQLRYLNRVASGPGFEKE
ncbi:MAG: hypothetical protein ACE5FI_12475 [Anaerolineales bacterium]